MNFLHVKEVASFPSHSAQSIAELHGEFNSSYEFFASSKGQHGKELSAERGLKLAACSLLFWAEPLPSFATVRAFPLLSALAAASKGF